MIDQSWESLRIEITKSPMVTVVKLFQLDFEIYRAARHHILYFKFRELHRWVAYAFDILGILFGCLLTFHFTFGSGDDHLSVLENQSRRPRFLDP